MGIEEIIATLGLKTTHYWVSLLKTLPPHEVGVIKVSAQLCRSPRLFHSFVDEVSYLVKHTGIILPIVVEARQNAFDFYQQKLAAALTQKGIEVSLIPPDLVHLRPTLRPPLWAVDTIFTAPIITSILHGRIPLLAGCGSTHENTTATIPALLLAQELVYTLHAKKLILVGHTPIRSKNGQWISEILSEEEWQAKILSRDIPPGMARRVSAAFDILARLGPGHSVQITSPQTRPDNISTGLLEELLGNGSGTYIAIPPLITAYPLEAIDLPWLFQTIQEAFLPLGKKLKPSYFESIRSYDPIVYLDSLRKGGAIVYLLEQVPYMCKLFTRQDYEGIGIGSTVIQTIMKHFGGLCWRTSRTNERATQFYEKIKDTYQGISCQTRSFTIYFLGRARDLAPSLTPLVDTLPSSFEETTSL